MLINSIFYLLLSNAVTLRRDKSILFSRNAILILISCLIITISELDFYFLENGIGIFGGLYQVNFITQTFNVFFFLISAIVLLLTAFHSRKIWHMCFNVLHSLTSKLSYNNTNITNKMGEQFQIIEYPLILLFIITGGAFLMSCNDIVSIFLSIELQSYGLYLLATLYRNSELSTSAGLTYFLLGGLSSCFILLGTSLLYVNYGTTGLDGYYIINSITSSQEFSNSDLIYKPFYLNMSLIILLVGFMFKISAAPFHFWSPDVYDAIPTIVTTFVAIIAKISILIFLLELLFHTSDLGVVDNYNWKQGLILSSLLSLIIGTVLGLSQTRIKRLFAYSTISHIGFILLAISIGSLESLQAFTFYLIQYTISNLNAFFILLAIGYSLYAYVLNDDNTKQFDNLTDTNNSPIQVIDQLRGYYNINPMLSISLAITLFSLVGIPPLIGFFAKQMVLSAALDSGYMFITLVAVLTSVISAFYYLSIIKQIFFENNIYRCLEVLKTLKLDAQIKPLFGKKPSQNIYLGINNIVLSNYYSITVSILTLTLLLFMYNPINLLDIVLLLGITLMNN